MDRLRIVAIVLTVTALVATVIYFYRMSSPVAQTWQAATVLPESQPLQPFSLIDQDGEPFNQESLRGSWNLLFFGFTHCPDICPATLQQLAVVQTRLGEDGLPPDEIPGVILISVDPARDQPATLASYVKHFGDAVRGVTGPEQELDALTRSLGIYYEVNGEGDDYTVNHSAAVVVIDPNGGFRAVFSGPLRTQAIAADLRVLIASK